ncbi:hypothetical protein [Thermogemmatispora tikiterensis]|uniref:Uncharacterized protein n=1 Tax=Thermogemmatispora tikiterensis TaxID=1825093 RepID=A0A328VJJ9_9CHLR|nr:hypothetical protein [Thermogemmatispora tikiterensis]RAQ95950.1 hypothetical protein A4R35_10425 [Thermogemmatispora tikiterensis]
MQPTHVDTAHGIHSALSPPLVVNGRGGKGSTQQEEQAFKGLTKEHRYEQRSNETQTQQDDRPTVGWLLPEDREGGHLLPE